MKNNQKMLKSVVEKESVKKSGSDFKEGIQMFDYLLLQQIKKYIRKSKI